MPPSSFQYLASDILGDCLARGAWDPGALRRLAAAACSPDPDTAAGASRALFGVIVEGLADRFEPRLADVYLRLFCQVMEMADPSWDAAELEARNRRVRRPRRFASGPERARRIYVLSRVTLGADIAVTSVLLDAVKRRFPDASIRLVGGEKSRRLFASDPRIGWLPVAYGRTGSLGERLAAGRSLKAAIAGDGGGIVIDPDSRLTQLGLIPVCEEEDYYFFDSRSYGAESGDPLAALAARWAGEVFGINGARPYLSPPPGGPPVGETPITVNLGVGENPTKRLPDPFEAGLLAFLADLGPPVFVDLGAGGEEEARARRAVEASGASPGRITPWRGDFWELAALISQSRLYVGYDSAGQHAAAACGVPLLTVFAGYPTVRMLERWTPSGPGPKAVIPAAGATPDAVLEQCRRAAARLLGGQPAGGTAAR